MSSWLGEFNWKFIVIMIYLIVQTAFTTKGIYDNYQLANETHGSLCVLKKDYEKRVTDSEAFLVKHPQGIPGLASRADILRSIQAIEANVVSLRNLNC